jgi:hypothetical protein
MTRKGKGDGCDEKGYSPKRRESGEGGEDEEGGGVFFARWMKERMGESKHG